MSFVQAILDGLLIGGVYAVISIGLTLVYGVMGIVNFAQAEFLTIGMFVAWFAWAFLGLDPVLANRLRERRRRHLTGPKDGAGEHLAEELGVLKMTAAELARRLNVPTNRVTEILNGQRSITGDTALRLAHFFGTSAEFWLNLQSLYELRLAEAKTGKAIKRLPTLKHIEDAHA